MSYNSIQCFNATIFDGSVTHCSWANLTHLYLGNNKLGWIEGNICNEDRTNILGFLKPLTSLQVLDLSSNMLGAGIYILSIINILFTNFL